MNVARGIRRPIMQHEQRRARARFENLLVDARTLPFRKLLRLALRQTSLHGKIGARQVQCFLQVKRFGH